MEIVEWTKFIVGTFFLVIGLVIFIMEMFGSRYI